MRIGMVGSLWLPTPPPKYGGTEKVIYTLTEYLVQKGHDVTLFAPEGTQTSARLIPTTPFALRDKNVSWENSSYTIFHLSEVFDRASEFDIIHIHLNKQQDYLSLPFALCADTPTLFTLHFRLPTPTYNPDRYRLLEKYRFLPFTSISHAQQDNSDINVIKTVYNSVNPEDYPFVLSPDNYFVWLGKIVADKGPKEAILAAKKAGVRLIMMGAVEYGVPEKLDYFEKEIKPLIDSEHITFLENVGLPKKAEVLGRAQALLNPIQWDEPFGLVMVESQSCGTPVIASKRGAAPELIQEGKTGFLIEHIEDMVGKIREVDTLSRTACRENVLSHFTPEKMVTGYIEAYEETIENWKDYISKQRQL